MAVFLAHKCSVVRIVAGFLRITDERLGEQVTPGAVLRHPDLKVPDQKGRRDGAVEAAGPNQGFSSDHG